MRNKIKNPDRRFEYEPAAYDTPERFYAYGHQIREILRFRPSLRDVRILNIGKGGGIVENYLGPHLGENAFIANLDVSLSLAPDICGNVTNLGIANEAVDLLVCCQTLQYVPFELFGQVLSEFQRVLKEGGRVILSLPNGGWYVGLNCFLPKFRIQKLMGLPLALGRVPETSKALYPGYWEINKAGVKENDVRGLVKGKFHIVREFRLAKHPHHHFFILDRRAPH